MAKEATLQVRMDAQLKEQAEKLYNELGTSFAEAVRIFARQSIIENGMPFIIHGGKFQAFGIAHKYSNHELISREDNAFEKAIIDKYETN